MGLAKTTCPSARAAIARPRLFKRLDEGRARPITWVWGPPGAGKTTLVASYLEARRLRALWYQLDPGDADLGSFFYYLRSAAADAAAQPTPELPLLTAEYLAEVTGFAQRFFRELCAALTPPFVLVLDNYQDVPGEAAFHEVLGHGLREVPDGGRVLLISRSEPPPAFARFRANRAVTTLGWDDLRLTESEATRLVARLGARPSAETLRTLYRTADGWAAGLVLMVEGARAKREPIRTPHPSQVVFDYFAAEVFANADPVTQDVLLQTAFLPRVTAEMANALTRSETAGRVLEELHRDNYFTNRYLANGQPEGEAAYQYHPLFRAFLLRRSHDVLSPERRTAIQRTCAKLLEDAGQVEDAADLLAEAHDWGGLARLVCQHAGGFCAVGRHRTVETWIERLPADQVEIDPWLLYWRGVASSPFDRGGVAALPDLEGAMKGFRARNEAAGAFLAWSAIIMTSLLEQTEVTGLDAWIRVFEELRAQFPVFPTPEIEAQVAVTMFTALMMRQPYPPAIDEWAERCQRLIEACPNPNLRSHLGSCLLGQHTSTGDFVKAALVAEQVRPLLRARGVGLQAQLLAFHIARLDWLTGAFASCRQTTEDGQNLGRQCGVEACRHELALERAFADLSEGRQDQVRELLERLDADVKRMRLYGRSAYHHVKGWSALLRNDLDTAFVEQAHVVELTRQMGWKWPEYWARIFAAQVLYRHGDIGEAEEHLRVSAEFATRARSHLYQFMIFLIEADLAFGHADDARGTEALRKAMAIGREKGYVNTWTWVPSTMAALCVRAMEAGIEVEYVEHLVRTRGLVPEHPPIHLERWPWRVKVLTLGRFQILRDDKLVEFSRKTQRRPLDLLRAVIAFGAENVHEERVADALWPDADGDAAQQALATALHRLRCLLGDDRALLRRDGRLTLDPRYCWVDVRAFDHCLTRAESAIRGRDATSNGCHASAEWTRKALALYQGHFMANEPWAAPFAERLRNRLDRHLRQLGPHCDEVPAWQERIASDGRVLAVHEGG